MLTSETQRMQYLDALGIDSYMPRRVLPHAPTIRMCAPSAAPVTGITPAQPAVATVAQVVASVRVAAGNETLENNARRGDAGKADTVVPGVAKASGDVAKPRFSLGLWVIDEELLVVDSRQPQAALPTEALLNNVIFALGYVARLPRVEVFNWPLHEKIPDAQGEDSARDALAAMLEAHAAAAPLKRCLLMGPEACYYCLQLEQLAALPQFDAGPTAAFESMQGKSMVIAGVGLTAVITPSLTQMLRDPGLKAVAWRAMQSLRKSV